MAPVKKTVPSKSRVETRGRKPLDPAGAHASIDLSVKVPSGLHEKLCDAAGEKGVSIAKIVRASIEAYLEI